jgi:hypothetical protein
LKIKTPLYLHKSFSAPIKKKIYLPSALMIINLLLLILEIKHKLNSDAELDLSCSTPKQIKDLSLLAKLLLIKIFMSGKLISEEEKRKFF